MHLTRLMKENKTSKHTKQRKDVKDHKPNTQVLTLLYGKFQAIFTVVLFPDVGNVVERGIRKNKINYYSIAVNFCFLLTR